MINEKNKFLTEILFEWAVIYRGVLSARVTGGPATNTEWGKQPISIVRVSGGFPGNYYNFYISLVNISFRNVKYNVHIFKYIILLTDKYKQTIKKP